jgi:hypothetical protein
MPDKHINELPTILQGDITDEKLWIIGDPVTGTLYEATIAQLKTLLTPEDNWKTVLSAAFGSVGGVGASTTTFGQVTGRSGAFAAEGTTTFIIGEECKIKRLFVATSTTQPASGAIILTLRKNFANTLLSVTIPANSAAGTFSDLINEIDLAAGDLIDYQFANAATGTSCTFFSIGATLVKSSI